MICKNLFSVISLGLFVFIGNTALAACPSADLTGDCFVDLEDFAIMANQWLSGDPNIPDDMAYIPNGGFEMGDHFAPEGWEDELPVHAVLVDAFFMSKFEITNQQYCDYLNWAYPAQLKVDGYSVYASSDTGNNYPYFNIDAQIEFSDPNFSVRTKAGRDMSDDPVVEVSWYGAVAYCNWRSQQEGYEICYDTTDPNWPCDFSKKGCRLPTEAEWEYAAHGGEHNPYFRFPWGDEINHDYANYRANGNSYPYDTSPYTTYTYHPDWNDGFFPYTSVVGSFTPNGYGLYDMAGNVSEWCNDWWSNTYYQECNDIGTVYNPTGPASGPDNSRVLRGGTWETNAGFCRVVDRYDYGYPDLRVFSFGFRIVLAH